MLLSHELDGGEKPAVYQNEHFLSQFDTCQSNTCVIQNRPHCLFKLSSIKVVWIYKSNTPMMKHVQVFSSDVNKPLSTNHQSELIIMNCHLLEDFGSGAPLTSEWEHCCERSCDSQQITALLKAIKYHRNNWITQLHNRLLCWAKLSR